MIDLHMHSQYSDDGEFAPEELVAKCLACNITTMSITDHNCAKANEKAHVAAQAKGIRYIPGIEIDCTYADVGFHVLGYGIDFRSKDFDEIEQNIERQSFRASLERLTKTQVMGFNVSEKDMWEISKTNYWQGTWTGEMFAQVILAKPEYAAHPLLAPYRTGGARSDNPYVNFYWDLYAQGRPCHAEVCYPPMKEVLDIIHQNRGLAVLAHPAVNLRGRSHLLEKMLGLGFDGIEAFSSYHTREQAEHYNQIACTRGLMVTCGSDYHGKTKPAIELGGAVFPCDVDGELKARQIAKAFGKRS